MELVHHFELPVGIDEAWEHLLDMEKVAACFPGATLTSADGEEYTGSVKVKLGPIQLTYKGSARIEDANEATHTATITASGSAARSGSTASMKVVASASPISETSTKVTMNTDLTITGRPAQFGRGVMAEVGDKILGKFADCLAATLAEPAPSEQPDSASPGDPAAATGAAKSSPAGTAGRAATADSEAGSTAQPSGYTRTPEPIDLLESARGSIIKRLAPVAIGIVVLCVLWKWRKGRKKARL